MAPKGVAPEVPHLYSLPVHDFTRALRGFGAFECGELWRQGQEEEEGPVEVWIAWALRSD